ncbi:MAG TPA: hypothetical protein DEA08_35395 [Planctomycetes bacterium]|nr:hypothetical protein [Planctomycetota bacterium]
MVVGLFALLYGSGVTGLLEPIRDEVRLVVPGAPGWGPLLVSVLLLSGVLSLLELTPVRGTFGRRWASWFTLSGALTALAVGLAHVLQALTGQAGWEAGAATWASYVAGELLPSVDIATVALLAAGPFALAGSLVSADRGRWREEREEAAWAFGGHAVLVAGWFLLRADWGVATPLIAAAAALGSMACSCALAGAYLGVESLLEPGPQRQKPRSRSSQRRTPAGNRS